MQPEKYPKTRFPLAHTFSIVARDPTSGEMGVAVQSHWFSTGSLVPWGEAGVGVVATQATVEPGYGPLGLALMRSGKSAEQALRGLLAADDNPEVRQVAFLDARGGASAHTGSRCIADAGHEVGEQFSVQANMMENPSVWPEMARAFRSTGGSLTQRLLAALQAAQAAGGDIRGQQSAAILVVRAQSTGRPWADRVIELRVEEHSDPIGELARLIRLQEAYEAMNLGDEQLAEGKVAEALQSYQQGARLAPEITELPFWHAVTLADLGRLEEALPIFRQVFAEDLNWAVLIRRLPTAGLLRDDAPMMARILKQTGEEGLV